MAWKCPNCETLNQGRNCVVCGSEKPASSNDNPKPRVVIGKKKISTGVIVLIAAVVLIVMSATIFLALYNKENKPVADVTSDEKETEGNITGESTSENGETTKKPDDEETTKNTETTSSLNETQKPDTETTEKETDSASLTGTITAVTLNTNSMDLKVGSTAALSAMLEYINGEIDKKVTWSTSNKAVASVSQNGLITAVGVGTAVITVKSVNDKTAFCNVQVSAIEVTGVALTASSVTLKTGEKSTIAAMLLPSDATDKSVTWTTSDAGVATVKNGIITAVGEGSASVTVKTTNGKTASCQVTVVSKSVEITSVTLDKKSVSLKIGEMAVITASFTPANATDTGVSWTSSNTSVAGCENGIITAVSAGTAQITASTSNGKKAVCTVTVTDNGPVSVSLSKTELHMTMGSITVLTAEVLPENSSDKTVEWISSDTEVVVCDNGKLTAISPGTAFITVKTVNGKEAFCAVTVTSAAVEIESLELDVGASITLETGTQMKLNVKIEPKNADDKTLSWKTSDENIVKILDNSGNILTGTKEGSATVTVTAKNGKTASCLITVKSPEQTENPITDFSFAVGADGTILLVEYIGVSENVIIPQKVNGLDVTSIYDNAFRENTKITSVIIPASVKEIGRNAFAYCYSLKTVTFSEGLIKIGSSAFLGSSVTEITLPSTLSLISADAFSSCVFLTDINVSPQNPYFASDAYGAMYDKYFTKLICMPAGAKTFVLPDTLQEIGDNAFYGCVNIKNTLTLPASVTRIGDYAFTYCSEMLSIEIPDGLTYIGTGAFAYCVKLNNFTIPASVAKINDKVFLGCSSLLYLIIHDAVQEIETGAFTGCISMTILCYEDSYAHNFADHYRIPYNLIITNP